MNQFADDEQLLGLMKNNKLFYCTNDNGNNYRYLAPYRELQSTKSNTKSNSKLKSKSNVTKKTSSLSKSSHSESKRYAQLFEKSPFNPKSVSKGNQKKYIENSIKGKKILEKDKIYVSVENIIIMTLMSKKNRGSIRTTIKTIRNMNNYFDTHEEIFKKNNVNTINDYITLIIKLVISEKKGLRKSAKNSGQLKAMTIQPQFNKTSSE